MRSLRDPEEEVQQQKLHTAIEETLRANDDLEEDQVLTGWIVVFEATSLGNSSSSAGHFYGPREMTTWKALGLVEWARRFNLGPDDDD